MIGAVTIVPWGLALLMLLVPRARPLGSRLAPAAAIPAAIVALLARGQSTELEWLLLGTRLGVDDTASVFLLLGSLVWTAAATYARSYLANDLAKHRFEIFFLATMGAQLGLSTASDALTFYLLFSVMTLSSYGLVVHDGSPRARRAGRVYLVMAILGEGLLLPGILLAVGSAGSTDLATISRTLATATHRDVILGLLLAGFAVKAGMPPFHFWLPLAHPAAPIPASAVLSGVLIKAGLLGWLRFLPLGSVDLPEWGGFLIVLGVAAALLGAAVGTAQEDPKSALAYSSISQMGWMAVIVGLGLGASGSWEVLLPILLLCVAQHGLAKSALFLGVGVSHASALPRVAIAAGLVLPALSLAGAPFTTGAALKSEIKGLLHFAPDPLPLLLPAALSVATFGTGLVLTRAILLLLPRAESNDRERELRRIPPLACGALIVAGLLLPWLWPLGPIGSAANLPALVLAATSMLAWDRLGWPVPLIRPGDLLNLIDWIPPLPARPKAARPRTLPALGNHLIDLLARVETRLAEPGGLTLLYITLLAGLALTTSGPSRLW